MRSPGAAQLAAPHAGPAYPAPREENVEPGCPAAFPAVGISVLISALCFNCVIPISSTTGRGAGLDAGTAPDSGGHPPPAGAWTNVTANLANMSSICGTVSVVYAKPDEDVLISAVDNVGMFTSRDGGGSWQMMGIGPAVANSPSSLVFDPDDATRYWESGIHGGGGGVFETSDDGQTFLQLGTITDNDLISVDFSDPERQTLLAGGHEQSNLWRSTDGGMTWVDLSNGAGLPAKTNCTLPLVIDAQTYLVGCGGYGGGPTGIYRTTDGGANWTNPTASGGVSPPLLASDASIYWASPNGDGMTRSLDDGQTWTDVVGAGVVGAETPIELPDGRIATLGPQYVMLSADHGTTWEPATGALPYSDATAVTYSSYQKAFYIHHFACGNGPVPVPSDAIMRFDFDYTTE